MNEMTMSFANMFQNHIRKKLNLNSLTSKKEWHIFILLLFLFLSIFRKTCLVCKCPRETHAIYQEQLTSVKERLGFKPTANLSTLNAEQLGYAWIPPGVGTANKVY